MGGGGFGPPMTGMTELPICTVCLERMDESVDGILTILCNHSCHGACLTKWGRHNVNTLIGLFFPNY